MWIEGLNGWVNADVVKSFMVDEFVDPIDGPSGRYSVCAEKIIILNDMTRSEATDLMDWLVRNIDATIYAADNGVRRPGDNFIRHDDIVDKAFEE